MGSLIDDRKGCLDGFERRQYAIKTRHATPRKTDPRSPLLGVRGDNFAGISPQDQSERRR